MTFSKFCNILYNYLENFDDMDPATFFKLIHISYNDTIGRKIEPKLLFYHIHNPNYSEITATARNRNGLVGIHHSENEREEIKGIIDLAPDFVVHMCHASDSDLELVKEAGISVVVCPRSNDYFGNRPPLEKMIDL